MNAPDRPVENEWHALLEEYQLTRQSGQRPSLDAFLPRVSPESRVSFVQALVRWELGRAEPESRGELLAEFGRQLVGQHDLTAAIDQIDPAKPGGGTEHARQTEATTVQLQPGRDVPAGFFSKGAAESLPGLAGRADINITLPGYEMLEPIGRGGMGIVYKARQTSLQRLCAVKLIIHGHLASDQARERFQQEAEVAASLQHPGIVQVYDYGTFQDMPYFSMEYIEGQSLHELVQSGPFESNRAADCVKCLAEAVEYAHGCGVLHRDLKPSNVLVDHEGQPRLSDFGLARAAEDSSMTALGDVLGTPSYMPPEQARGDVDQLSPASDVYSLGGILYELLVGEPPLSGDTHAATLELVKTTVPRTPRSVSSTVDVDLNTICMKCLEKDPQRRYPSAQKLADDLQRFLERRPIKARPVGVAGRMRRWCQRNPMMAGLSVLLLLAVIIGSMVAYYGVRKARQIEAERLLTQSQNAARSGKWEETLSLLEQASQLGHPDPLLVELEKVAAYNALNRPQQAAALANDLRQRGLDGPHAGHIKALVGDQLLMRRSTDEALELLRESLNHELPDDERAFVKGLLAGSSNEALRHFQSAVEINNLHYRAMINANLLLLALGEFSEAQGKIDAARSLFPNDPNLVVLKAMLQALQGQYEEAHDQLDRLQRTLASTDMDWARKIINLLTEMRKLPDVWDTGDEESMIVLKEMGALIPSFEKATGQENLDAAQLQLVVPPYLQTVLKDVSVANADKWLVDPSSSTDFLRKLSQVHEEGMLPFVTAAVLIANGNWVDSIEFLETARDRPLIIPELQWEIEYAYASASYFAAFANGQTERLPQALAAAKKRIAGPPMRPLQAKYFELFLRRAEQTRLAQEMSIKSWRAHPDDQELGERTIQLCIDNQNFGEAAALLDTYKQRWPMADAIENFEKALEQTSGQPNNAQAAINEQAASNERK